MVDESELSRRIEKYYRSDQLGPSDGREMTEIFFAQPGIPFIETAEVYDSLTDEQRAVVDSWQGGDFVDKADAFEEQDQRNRNLYGQEYWD